VWGNPGRHHVASNIKCGAIIRAWNAVVEGDYITSADGRRAIEEIMVKLYADYDILTWTKANILQEALDLLVRLFERVGLKAKTSKTKSMTSKPGSQQGPISNHAYMRRMNGQGSTYVTHKKRRVMCSKCDKEMATGCMARYQRQVHDSNEIMLESPVVTTEERECQYDVRFPSGTYSVEFPVEACFGSMIMEEPPPLRFVRYIYPRESADGRAQVNGLFRQGHGLKIKRAVEKDARKANGVVFTVRGIPLNSVKSFFYLGRELSYRWTFISLVLTREGVSPRVSSMFYKSVVQTVLLYGSENWVLRQPQHDGKVGGFSPRDCAPAHRPRACLPPTRGRVAVSPPWGMPLRRPDC
jgi:hypothetical protein